ncbi:MAG: phosphoribosylglycinamide synthetase C domain-containing protein [Candidatus Pelagibacter sp.]
MDKKIINKIIEPTLKGLKDLGTDFKGFLYAGLMIVKNEPYLIEYNVRMGDPECQTILPRLKTDLLDLLLHCCNKNLSKIKLDWHEDKSLCVVLCSKGYPENYYNNLQIDGLNKIKVSDKEYIYHAGTKKNNNIIYSNGGRVLNFSVLSKDLKDARTKAIKMIQQLDWNNGYYRKDIGFKAIKD